LTHINPYVVYNYVNYHFGPKLIDGSDVKTILSKLKNGKIECFYKPRYDTDGNITGLFYMPERVIKTFEHVCNVPIIDSTYKTNVYNYNLIMLYYVDRHDHTAAAAAAVVVKTETTEDYLLKLEKQLMTNGIILAISYQTKLQQ